MIKLSLSMGYRPVRIYVLVLSVLIFLNSCTHERDRRITIIGTTDVHGVILPFDFIENEEFTYSLANVSNYVKNLRKGKDAVLLLDNGDNLQGQPEVYFYNYIDTVSPHFLSEAMNQMGYDAGTTGNHDIETGHPVYDRLVREYNFPLLAANAVDVKTGKPYFKPYVIIERNNIRVAVLGLITPSISSSLPPELYSGIEFRDMVETAEQWMPEILRQNPDLVIGLFHSGWDSENESYLKNNQLIENGSAAVAYNVKGFDIIFAGHDHRLANEKFISKSHDTVLILNSGSRSENIARADITISRGRVKGKNKKSMTGSIVNIGDFEPDPEFIRKFEIQGNKVREYVTRVIGFSTAAISTRDSYFGPSAFVDMLHKVQLDISGADISFAAPLSFDVRIEKGPVTVGDMFKLYRYENMLYSMSLSGNEIRNYLEYSYAEWLNTMKGPDDHLLKLRLGKDGKPVITNGKAWLMNASYNFDSAAGINYTVDASKPEGNRIIIKSFSDGRPFEKQHMYKVALSSYRGSGGGGHLIEGAGLNKEELSKRLISSTDRDLRYFILKYIEAKKTINPVTITTWEIIPGKWTKVAKARDYRMLFGTNEFSK